MKYELSKGEEKALKLLKIKEEIEIEEAAGNVASRLNITVENAAKIIYLLWKKGYLDLVDERVSKSFSSYFLSWESLWYWILVSYIALTSLTVAFVSKSPLIYLRYILGSALVLYIPGAALIEALYPSSELEPLERFALSIGLSLAIVPLIGLILNYTPWGIRLEPVLYSLILFSLAVGFTALIRKYMILKGELANGTPSR